jgi:hypothetical protein
MKFRFITALGIPLLACALLAPRLIAQPVAQTTSPVQRFIDGSTVGGAFSTLVRSDDALRMHVSTSDLDPGAAYTVWWVIFNFPENCSAPCNMDDITNPALRTAVQTAVGFAAGHVVGNNGKGNFSGLLKVGDLSGFGDGVDSTPPPPLGPGLLNPLGAEVHLVIRTHGQQIPGLVDEQIHTFEGGCSINACDDKQFSMHLPPS